MKFERYSWEGGSDSSLQRGNAVFRRIYVIPSWLLGTQGAGPQAVTARAP